MIAVVPTAFGAVAMRLAGFYYADGDDIAPQGLRRRTLPIHRNVTRHDDIVLQGLDHRV